MTADAGTLSVAMAPPRWFTRAIFGLLAIVTIIQAIWVVTRALDDYRGGMLGYDFSLYTDAARRWLDGGSFYLPYQLVGPYDVPWGQILYPPQALVLFVPFALAGSWAGVAFSLIPLAITAAMLWTLRPRLWAWAVILALLLVWPLTLTLWIAGNPTIWVIALVALATRWPWLSAFVWFKPSVFPFALGGIRDRRWWVVTAAIGLAGLVMWPLTRDWITALLNARGENSGLGYSLGLGSLAGPLIPVVAWLGAQDRPQDPALRLHG
jgi:hypothetical protein